MAEGGARGRGAVSADEEVRGDVVVGEELGGSGAVGMGPRGRTGVKGTVDGEVGGWGGGREKAAD